MKKEFAIKTHNLSKYFRDKEVIQHCNMRVRAGSIYCLLGKNGAGKTTLFKLLLGLLSPSMGEAEIFGMDCKKERLEILSKTGAIIENPIFYEHLSAEENLKLHLAYMGIEDNDRIEAVLEQVGLKASAHQSVSTFSLGMCQRLAIARAIVHKPEVLLLDEPINGMDAVGIREMRELLCKLAEQGVTILMSSHILSEVELVADTIGFLVDGMIVQEVELQEILENHPNGLEEYFLNLIQKGTENYESN
jgi:ABC-2 type transport system ATP-binding protein